MQRKLTQPVPPKPPRPGKEDKKSQLKKNNTPVMAMNQNTRQTDEERKYGKKERGKHGAGPFFFGASTRVDICKLFFCFFVLDTPDICIPFSLFSSRKKKRRREEEGKAQERILTPTKEIQDIKQVSG